MNRLDYEVLIKKEDYFALSYICNDDPYKQNTMTSVIYQSYIQKMPTNDEELLSCLEAGEIYYSDNDTLLEAINAVLDYWVLPEIDEVPSQMNVYEDYTQAIHSFPDTEQVMVFKLKEHLATKPKRPTKQNQKCGVVTCIHNANGMCMTDTCDLHIRMYRQEG